MKRIIFLSVLFLIFTALNAYSSIPELNYRAIQQQHITDDELIKATINRGIIPKDANEAFLKGELEKKNTITAWIMMDHKSKFSVIDKLREQYKKDNVIIKLPSDYYVNEINIVIYNSILNGDINPTIKRGMGNIFKTIAIMEGDYDNGKDKVTVAKEYMGEEIFQQYKELYPEKYEKLISK